MAEEEWLSQDERVDEEEMVKVEVVVEEGRILVVEDRVYKRGGWQNTLEKLGRRRGAITRGDGKKIEAIRRG